TADWFRWAFTHDGFTRLRGLCLCYETTPTLDGITAGMQYRCEAVSREAFVQQLANYVAAGYWRYVSGSVPLHKNPADVDHKLVGQYGIDISKWARSRRKKAGGGNAHYLRHERTFVLLVSPGPHPSVEGEPNLRDIRRAPLRF